MAPDLAKNNRSMIRDMIVNKSLTNHKVVDVARCSKRSISAKQLVRM